MRVIKKKAILLFSGMLIVVLGFGQRFGTSEVYRIRPWIDGGITVFAGIGNFSGLNIVKNKPRFTEEEIATWGPEDVNWFDRAATRLDPEIAANGQNLSDLGANIGNAMPLILALDSRIRKDWMDILLLYLETGFVNGAIYSWPSGVVFDRPRPLVYNPREPLERKLGPHLRTSFFSGHVSTTATGTFFAAKVFIDYHPEIGNKKYLIYGGASLIPIFVGVNRYRAGKHFLSDILIGLFVGSSVGIIMPELHKRDRINKMAILPITGDINGLGVNLRF
ncbi:MAG: phosphatase PAP2 family protein [Bacteroidota bacterium]